jgi:hypothetical protein
MSRRFQFSLRAVFALVAVVALVLGCIAFLRHQLNEFHCAAEPIEKVTGRRIRAGGDGIGAFQGTHGIVYVDLTGGEIGDEVLASLLPDLKRLPRLGSLFLSRSAITDFGLESLWQLKQLRCVYLDGTKVTADGVGRLQKELPDCHIEWQQ